LKKPNLFDKYLNFVEKGVDKLPDPFFLFLLLAILVLVLSYIGDSLTWSAVHPGTNESIQVINLIEKHNFYHIFSESVSNFINFPPLGIVLVMVIGIGVADKSGFFKSLINATAQMVNPRLIAVLFIFISVNGSVMADSGVVLLPPLGALVFSGLGYHPITGLAAGFVGVCGGFSANIGITALDPLLASLTEPAARMIISDYNVFPTANYYFMAASVFVITLVIYLVSVKIIEPRVKTIKIKPFSVYNNNETKQLTHHEKRGLMYAFSAIVIFFILILIAVLPEQGLLRNENGDIMPFFKSIIFLLMAGFFMSGTVYGIAAGTITNSKDIISMSTNAMNTMGSYIVLAFAIAQFTAYFSKSNLGLVTAINGAEFLKNAGLTGVLLVIGFLIFSMIINIFIASASAKWAILSVVFVPMFLLLGIPPEITQAVYRVGDSVTNFITPMFPYFPIIIVFAKEISEDISFGKLVSLLIPYSLILSLVWGIFLILWIYLGIPVGPGVPTDMMIIP